ncbi:hypothetical protein BJ912DRAFT_391935 [Pholiota molesta]|nr:hypothetical protein BJ912DRAFT_391935 [Pholiota molesta]
MAPVALLSLANSTIDNTVGAIFLGVVGASLLFGITTLQAYWYYHSYYNDSRLHKCAVALLWTLDAFHLALVVHTVYAYAVTGFGNVHTLSQIEWSLKLQVSVNVVVILLVHSLYTSRVWLLGGYHQGFLGYIVTFVVVGGFVIGVIFAYMIYTVHTFLELETISWAINAALATSTTIDFIIAASMCYYLSKSKGTITRLNSRISTIIQYTLSSGLLTSAFSLGAMFSYILLPNTFVFIALEFLLTKLYVGSFIAMLNSRERKMPEVSSLGQYTADASWKQPIALRTTSNFRSPRSDTISLECTEAPTSPPASTVKLTHIHDVAYAY